MLRQGARAAGVALLGVLAATVLFEAALRLVELTPLWRVLPVAEGVFYGPDAEAGYTLRPGARGLWLREQRARHRVNSHGMLEREVRRQAAPGVQRVAVLGDSVTEALQVPREQTFTRLAEQQLTARGVDVQVLNFGLAGATPAVLAARLQATAMPLAPDLVVFVLPWTVFQSSSLGDDSAFTAYNRTEQGWRRTHGFRQTRGYQLRSSAAGRFLYRLMGEVRVLAVLNARKNAGWLADLGAARRPAPAASRCADAGVLDDAARDWADAGVSDSAARTAAFLDDVGAQLRAAGIHGVLVLDGLEAICPDARAARSAFMRTVRERSAVHRLQAYDLHAMVTASQPRPLRGFGASAGHGHLNRHGHAHYARALTRILAPMLVTRAGS